MNVKDDGAVESYLNSYNYKRFNFIAAKSQHLATVNAIKRLTEASPPTLSW
ncbi:hypothetical protein EV13_0696 [Prochlorococcus sp. MIT 0702]|nr:hypothetical protein EV13_0696 [Prochlorococcus sp. MIT 0702]KGG34148.1 hypothetical protein EV14_1495 [Prochlorococcus sp. MIT 0703]